MPIACVVVPHFALRVALLARPELDGTPLVLGPPPGARPVVIDATPEAAARGVRPGIGLREVVALCPDAVVLAPHPAREAAAAERLLADLEHLSPVVEDDDDVAGVYYADLRGSDRLLGPPPAVAERLRAAVPAVFRPRLGLAPNRFAARVAAHHAPPGGIVVFAPDDLRARLAPAPVALLPLPPDRIRRLERLGLPTLGDLAALPPAAVAARFGGEGRRWWELANGRDDTPVRPRPPRQTVTEAMELPAPATSRETLLIALTELALRAFARPALRGRHVRQARLQGLLEEGGSWEQLATLREPGGPRRVVAALGYRLDGATLPGPVVAMRLDLLAPIDATGRQEGLPGFSARRPHQLVEAKRQLEQRFGTSGLYRVVEVEPWSRIPERRMALVAFEP